MAGAGGVGDRGQTQNSGGDLPTRRLRWTQRGGAVCGETVLRATADDWNSGAECADQRCPLPLPPGAIGPNAIDLDGKFGFNPALQPLKALWDKEQLAIVEATGSPDPSRSHFDAQDYMESGTPEFDSRWVVESGAAGGGSGDGFSATRDRDQCAVAADAARGSVRDCGERPTAIQDRQRRDVGDS